MGLNWLLSEEGKKASRETHKRLLKELKEQSRNNPLLGKVIK